MKHPLIVKTQLKCPLFTKIKMSPFCIFMFFLEFQLSSYSRGMAKGRFWKRQFAFVLIALPSLLA
jgi:hypothetical protein